MHKPTDSCLPHQRACSGLCHSQPNASRTHSYLYCCKPSLFQDVIDRTITFLRRVAEFVKQVALNEHFQEFQKLPDKCKDRGYSNH